MRAISRVLVLILGCTAFMGVAFGKSSSSVTLTSSSNPSTYGNSVTFTATVTPSAATGTVTFKDGSTTLGTGTLSSGKTTFSTSTLTVGSHSITAAYGGDANYNGSTSSVLTQTVNKASTTVTLASSKNPSTFGTSVKFTATLSPSAAPGTVTFNDGSTALGTGTISSGKATFSISTLTAGSHSITAAYAGGANYNSSTSAVLTQTVNKGTTTTTLASSSNPSAFGSSVTFTATVSPSTATGTVTFNDGSTTLGTGTISSGKATFSTSALAVGSHSIKASYGGDANDNSSTSSTLTQKVEQPSTTALTSSTNPAPYGAPVTFTATVLPAAATGTVTFNDGGTALATVTIGSGPVVYTTSSLAVGSHSITAVYSGNTTYAGSTSPILTQKVLTVTAISVTPPTASLPVGATQQFTATGTFSDGSQGNITSSATWTSSDVTVVSISAVGIATGVDEGPATIQAAVGTINGSASLTGTPSRFRLTGSTITVRAFNTATTLQNGQVLIVGGAGGANEIGACELFNPLTGTFTPTGSLIIPRAWHTATLLQNGQVLIAGGEAINTSGNGYKPTQAELYDPATGLFSYTGNLNLGRFGDSATLLQNGMVLIAGGDANTGTTAELYDPVAGTFTYTGSLNTALFNHSATLLNDGTVLIAGGDNLNPNDSSPIAVAEIYNPTAGTFTPTGNLNIARESHTATLLTNGKVLIAGGSGSQGRLASVELYDPVAKVFSLTGSLAYARAGDTATLLNSGQTLIVGGAGPSNHILAAAELYDPTAGTFSLAGNLNIPRGNHTASLLSDGTVLIAGGGIPEAEIYQSAGSPIQPPDSIQITPASANVMVGGTRSFTAIDNFGYPRHDVTWTVSDPSLATVAADEDDAAVLTGIAAGQITLTANAENVTAQAQVTIAAAGTYSPGTVIWSAPPVSGFSPIQLVQAVSAGLGPDLYSTLLSSDGTKAIVQALTADGQQLWQTPLPTLSNNSVADGVGGLIVTEYDTCTPGQKSPLTVVDLDPVYGQPTFSVQAAGVWVGNNLVYCYGGADAPQMAVRGDGAVIISEPTNNGFPPLTVMNTPLCCGYNLPIPTSTNTDNGNTIQVQCCMGSPMVNSDGTAYVEYEVRNVVNNVITSDNLYLKEIASTDNNFPSILLSSTTQNQALLPGSIVPDGQGGIVATWTISPSNPPLPQHPYQAVDVVAGVVGTPYSLPLSPNSVAVGKSPTIVLGENGVAFATNGTDTVNGPVVASFNVVSGTVNWSNQALPAYTISLIAAADGNGLAAKSTDQSGNDTLVTFDVNGNPSNQTWASGPVSGLDFFVADDSWIGHMSGTDTYSEYSAPPVELSTSNWPGEGGTGSNAASHDFSVTNFSQMGTNQDTIASVMQKIISALPTNAKCNNWFQAGGQSQGSGLQQMQAVLTANNFGHGTVNLDGSVYYQNGAFSGLKNPDKTLVAGIQNTSVVFTVNDVGSFFNQYQNGDNTKPFLVGKRNYPGGTLKAQATMLIHETAHQITVTGFQPDFGNSKAGKANDKAVDSNCRQLIEGLQ
jgi:uncharacterized protein YjdB